MNSSSKKRDLKKYILGGQAGNCLEPYVVVEVSYKSGMNIFHENVFSSSQIFPPPVLSLNRNMYQYYIIIRTLD